jgi:Protein of unknown function (DUF3014)
MRDFYGIERSRRREWPILLLIVLVLAIPVALGVLAYRLLSSPAKPAAVANRAAAPLPTAAPSPTLTPVASQTPLPELDQSDAFVRLLVEALSSRPAWVAWLATEGLVRRFVVVVDNVAEGRSPKQHLAVMAPKEKFTALGRGGTERVDPQSYHRYDTIADVVASLDTKGCMQAYRQLKPLVQEAYRQLGYPDRDFDLTLARAIDRMLEIPVPQGDVKLRPAVKSYKLADPKLEALSPVQKQFLRMGADNMRKVQPKLREIREELSLPEGEETRLGDEHRLR